MVDLTICHCKTQTDSMKAKALLCTPGPPMQMDRRPAPMATGHRDTTGTGRSKARGLQRKGNQACMLRSCHLFSPHLGLCVDT